MSKHNDGMLAQVRQQSIAELVSKKGNVTVNDLCSTFNVSPATIRNDLRSLEDRGAVKRTHGGAISCNKSAYELNTLQKEVQNVEKKRAIADEAIKQIQEGDAIALDSGTTTFELAKLLVKFNNLTVLTNDLQIAAWLEQNTEVNIIMIGGSVRRNFRCTVGQSAIDMLTVLHVDKAFVAVNGVSVSKGLSTPSLEMAGIKKQMIDASDQVILLSDSSKINRTAFASYAPVRDVNTFITDEMADPEFIDTIRRLGIDVITARLAEEA